MFVFYGLFVIKDEVYFNIFIKFCFKAIYGTQISHESSYDECLKLKGQMMYVKEWDSIIFLATPV
jgi:hypothetical protein